MSLQQTFPQWIVRNLLYSTRKWNRFPSWQLFVRKKQSRCGLFFKDKETWIYVAWNITFKCLWKLNTSTIELWLIKWFFVRSVKLRLSSQHWQAESYVCLKMNLIRQQMCCVVFENTLRKIFGPLRIGTVCNRHPAVSYVLEISSICNE